MRVSDRRTFLKMIGAGALAGAAGSIEKALAIAANNRTGTIKDVEHIVILTQENRSFDHYFGTLRGVRGFNDPRAVSLPSGQPVWRQPFGTGELLPYRPPVEHLGTTFLPDPPHGWNDAHAAWNDGNHDRWVENKGVATMIHHTRSDLPFHFALADAFTICDAYHCSVMGPTDPNRYHLWTGWIGNDGAGGGPVITNAQLGYTWSTYPERLQKAGITWRVYQDIGHGLNGENGNRWGATEDPYVGNYGNNALLYFTQYQNAHSGDPLHDFTKTGTEIRTLARNPFRLLDDFREDVRTGQLPQVSWITAPEAYSEHPNFPPDYGAWYIAQVLDILASHREVWSRTALFINYDEDGGFFDHMVPPTPPRSPEHGASTIDTFGEIYPGDSAYMGAPYGLGMRVPMLVVSPWSRGGWVNSQVFDHTSLIRFIEARYADEYPDLIETNITPWRRAIVGDLTSAFDFATPNPAHGRLPSTAAFLPRDRDRHGEYAPVPPVHPVMPRQEPGLRQARALPYALHAHGTLDTNDSTFRIEFANSGTATAVFHVRSRHPSDAPRSYTVEPDKRLVGVWDISDDYNLTVHGPNGFMRVFKGSISGRGRAQLDVRVDYASAPTMIILSISNPSPEVVNVATADKYTDIYNDRQLGPGESLSEERVLASTFGWYDLLISVIGEPELEFRFAGHVEDGHDSMSDPVIGRPSMGR